MRAKGLNSIVNTCLIAALIASCAADQRDSPSATPPVESGLLQKGQIVALLADIHLAEAAHKSRIFIPEQSEEVLLENYSAIFAAHGITQEEFRESYTWWWKHPAAMKSVLQEVTEPLNKIEQDPSN